MYGEFYMLHYFLCAEREPYITVYEVKIKPVLTSS